MPLFKKIIFPSKAALSHPISPISLSSSARNVKFILLRFSHCLRRVSWIMIWDRDFSLLVHDYVYVYGQEPSAVPAGVVSMNRCALNLVAMPWDCWVYGIWLCFFLFLCVFVERMIAFCSILLWFLETHVFLSRDIVRLIHWNTIYKISSTCTKMMKDLFWVIGT